MKKTSILTIVFVIIGITQGVGQYDSVFGEESTEWSYVALYCDSGPTSILTVSGDTIIENIEYKTISREENTSFEQIGLLRESVDKSKVWFRNFDESDEILIMDLDMSISDTFMIGDDEYSVDSVYFDDDNRKVIQFDLILDFCGSEFKLKFIEGVGTNLGFDYISSQIYPFFTSIIYCHTKDGVTEHFRSPAGCPPFLSTHNINIQRLDIYPNPTSGDLKIELPEILSGRLSVKSLTGQVVFTQNIKYSENLSLDLYGQEEGMYLIEVVSESGERWLERVVLTED